MPGTLFMFAHLVEQSESMAIVPFLVCHCRGNRELQFCARSNFTPEIEARADSFCPLPHSRDAKVSGLSAFFQDLGGDPFAIVPYAQTKLILIVPDLHFDVGGEGVGKGISDRL